MRQYFTTPQLLNPICKSPRICSLLEQDHRPVTALRARARCAVYIYHSRPARKPHTPRTLSQWPRINRQSSRPAHILRVCVCVGVANFLTASASASTATTSDSLCVAVGGGLATNSCISSGQSDGVRPTGANVLPPGLVRRSHPPP